MRPPVAPEKERIGVFATRSPFRPNPLGLSVVKLEKVQLDSPDGPVLWVSGADLMNGTPIYDIKPYLAYADSVPEARGGFTESAKKRRVMVEIPEDIKKNLSETLMMAVSDILAEDPRPAYQNDPDRIYKMIFDGYEFAFFVKDELLSVCEVTKL